MQDRNDELTPQERADFAALPRERQPRRLLEEHTVKALRARGWLQRHRMRDGWLAAAAAAALALFAGGLAVGQRMATRDVASSLLAAQEQTAMQAAQMVQRTGTAYVTALAALAQLADTADEGAVRQGREAAQAALYAAAAELVALAPDDPLAIHIRRLLAGMSPPADTGGVEARNVVWF